jgi:hypothetical protein
MRSQRYKDNSLFSEATWSMAWEHFDRAPNLSSRILKKVLGFLGNGKLDPNLQHVSAKFLIIFKSFFTAGFVLKDIGEFLQLLLQDAPKLLKHSRVEFSIEHTCIAGREEHKRTKTGVTEVSKVIEFDPYMISCCLIHMILHRIS